MKAPSFWYKAPGFLSTLLSPLGWGYGLLASWNYSSQKPQHFSIPVISVGNLVCGGAGKTPVALSLAKILQEKGFQVHFVTRGYKGREQGPLKVNTSQHSARDVGDEPLLLAQQAPTWVSKKRGDGIQKAIENKADLVILDDGHQTKGIVKDLSFIVVDSLQGFGNGLPLPAGPLREPLTEGLKRTHAVILLGEPPFAMGGPQPFYRARIILQPLTLPTKSVVAFCGIGFPQKFYHSLKKLKVDLVATKSFPDHHIYTEKDLCRLANLAKKNKATLLTTRKDWIKMNSSWQKQLHVSDIAVQFEDAPGLYRFILEKIPSLKEERA